MHKTALFNPITYKNSGVYLLYYCKYLRSIYICGMKQILLLVGLIALLSTNSCENVTQATGPIQTISKNTNSFNSILNDIDADVMINIDSTSNQASYTVHAQQEVINNLDIKSSNNELVITYKDGSHILTTENITIDINTNSLEAIKLLGSGNVTTNGVIVKDKILVSIMGSGDVKVKDATARKMVLEVAGSGDIEVTNSTVLKGEYAVKGSGDINAENVVTGDLKAQVTGSGDITTTAVNSIDASVTGSGSIYYKGNPQDVKSNITGSGEIVKK
jgi:hypothetical protein